MPIEKAIKLPFLLSRKCCFTGLPVAKVSINGPITFGMIKFGLNNPGMVDYKYRRTLLNIKGELNFKGSANFGAACVISVNDGARLNIGNHFHCTGATQILCMNAIEIGDDCLFSWDIQLMDSDSHQVIFEDGTSNTPKPVIIGNHVWVGCKVNILKGVIIKSGSVVASGSIVTKQFIEPNILIGKSPAVVIKRNIQWNN